MGKRWCFCDRYLSIVILAEEYSKLVVVEVLMPDVLDDGRALPTLYHCLAPLQARTADRVDSCGQHRWQSSWGLGVNVHWWSHCFVCIRAQDKYAYPECVCTISFGIL
jgi:hypothetical protein